MNKSPPINHFNPDQEYNNFNSFPASPLIEHTDGLFFVGEELQEFSPP
jgi:hypothetical protein